jgi:hypothetical protein
MGKDRFSRAIQFAFVALLAVAFFYAGYGARTVQMASAQVPQPGPSYISDGDPSGHNFVSLDAQTKLSAVARANVVAALKVLA